MDKLITFKQAAEVTATSESFWRKLAARRLIGVVRLGRACRLREADALAWIAANQRPARERTQ